MERRKLMNKEINVLSLFDGMSCGQIALERSGVKVENYFASEIDKYAIQITQKNYPNTIQLGDVENWKNWDINWNSIDLLIGGSPCQGFSFIGKQLSFDDPRSKLFFVYVDILNHIKRVKPDVKFLLENVKMKKEYQNVISSCLDEEPIFINSKVISAGMRPRLYWTNIHIKNIIEKNILLRDVIDFNKKQEDKYYLSEKFLKGVENSKSVFKNRFKPHNISSLKAYTLTARYFKMGKSDPYIKDNFGIRKLTPIECERLQTVPDNYTEGVSNTQRYKMLGNGWTVDVISHIFNSMVI